MCSRYISLLILGITYSKTLAQLCPELAYSNVAPAALIDIDVTNTLYVRTDRCLTFFTPFTEYFTVNHTEQSIDIVRMKNHPIGLAGTLRGGVLGDDIYVYSKSRFYWLDNCTTGAFVDNYVDVEAGNRLEVLVFYHNRKYGSFENALNFADGIVQVSSKIYVLDGRPNNSLFAAFGRTMKKIRKPGKHRIINGGLTYQWFIYFPEDSEYCAYRSTYTDDETGNIYPATTIVMPPNCLNYLSYCQFKDTFGAITDCCGDPLVNIAPRCPQAGTTVVRSKGITILNIVRDMKPTKTEFCIDHNDDELC